MVGNEDSCGGTPTGWIPKENFESDDMNRTYIDNYNPPLDEFKFNEKVKLNKTLDYIKSTYSKHYAKGITKQATETIADAGHLEGFCVGNIIKYAQRYGKKAGEDKNNNLMKIIHYAVILMDKEDD